MSRTIKEGSYAPMLQGVSQQVEHERLPGQVQEQINMLSDPQTGIRRRPGASVLFTGTHGGNAISKLVATEATIGGTTLHVHVDAAAGNVKLYDSAGTNVSTLSSTYLITENREDIRFANLNDELFILNTSKAPITQTSLGASNELRGFFYIEAGAFNKRYRVEVRIGAYTYYGDYTTPDGTGATDAAACTPAAIASALLTSLNTSGMSARINGHITGQYVYLNARFYDGTLEVRTDDSVLYVVTSGKSRLKQASQLPARLAAEADGYVVATGDTSLPVYYTWDYDSSSWLESSAANTVSGIADVPISIYKSGGVYALDATNFEGRPSGDGNTNPEHAFMQNRKITGMAAYQGRLVLLSGNMVSMSATNKPRRFFRSTVTSLLDSDPIEIGSGNITSANFTYAVAFNKDLVLFADRVQAVIPSLNTALTPRNAALVLTGAYSTALSAAPVASGRTLLFPVPRSPAKYGVLEMVPSSSTDSQYTSLDVTSHLPSFFDGPCRFTAASAVSRIAVFATSNTKQLIIHEFMWDNESKAQSAWHVWEFQLDVAYAYFYGGELIVCFSRGTTAVMCTINPRATSYQQGFLDLGWDVQLGNAGLGDNVGVLPKALRDMLGTEVLRGVLTGDPAVEIKVTRSGALLYAPADVSGYVRVGLDYTSSVTPTKPVIRDYKDRPVLTGKTSLQKLIVHSANSGPYRVVLDYSDAYPDETLEQGAVLWESDDLQLGGPPIAGRSTAVVPCRSSTQALHTRIETKTVYELNIVQLDYVTSTARKLQRS